MRIGDRQSLTYKSTRGIITKIMVEFEPCTVSVKEIARWQKDGTLSLSPKFQRRKVWKPKARAYLIDTITNRLPIPKIFLRQSRDPKTGKTIHEMVDGQQRLRTVLEFLDGQVRIPKGNEQGLSGCTFDGMPQKHRRAFLRYKFSVDLLKGARDKDVHDLFRRLNTYTYSLSRQERRNGRYFGPFKRTVYALSTETYDFWINNNIFTPGTISRMAEAELISELLVVMLSGLQDKKETPLRIHYEKYEAEGSFKEKNECVKRFRHCLRVVKGIFGDELKSSEFKRRPLFYSMFCVIFDALYVMPGSPNASSHTIPRTNHRIIKRELMSLSDEVKKTTPKLELLPFVEALARQTDNVAPRKVRHQFIWDAISKYFKPV